MLRKGIGFVEAEQEHYFRQGSLQRIPLIHFSWDGDRLFLGELGEKGIHVACVG